MEYKNNKTYRENAVRFPKCNKQVKTYKSADGDITVVIDKNGQLCGGSFAATHKGRPCLVEGRSILTPITEQVWDNKKEQNVSVFSHYEVLIETFKVNK